MYRRSPCPKAAQYPKDAWRRAAVLFFFIFTAMFPLCLPSPDAARAAEPGPFVPDDPIVPAAAVRAGSRGHMLTVLKGTKPVRIPIEVVSVVPQKGDVRNAILIRLLPSPNNRAGGIAQGMSGSPVYVDGRLAGAVGIGWAFSDHNLALVTPIEDMCAVFSAPDRPAQVDSMPAPPRRPLRSDAFELEAPVAVAGLSEPAAGTLGRALGLSLAVTPVGANEALQVERGRLTPGEAISLLLVWGDVEVAATGTVTATSKDGRFLAFGHSFLERGAVNFPAARAQIHETVRSAAFPFKLASPISIVGTVTQDRGAGIGGRTDFFAPSISASLAFRDADQGRRLERRFRVVPDTFLSGRLLAGIYAGLLDDAWRRKGPGTMNVTLRIEGRGVQNGWTRNNVFFSDENIAAVALRESARILEAFLIQPFADGMPLGFRLDVEATEEPRIILIEDVQSPAEAKAGEDIEVSVTLRPWRRRPVTRKFSLTVPRDATGICELVVRGGGVHPMPQLSIEGGWKSIDSLKRMLEEIGSLDANNELIVELHSDSTPQPKKERGEDKRDTPELLPEEKEFLSETKERRIREGTLRIARSDYFVDGMMRRLVTVTPGDEAK